MTKRDIISNKFRRSILITAAAMIGLGTPGCNNKDKQTTPERHSTEQAERERIAQIEHDQRMLDEKIQKRRIAVRDSLNHIHKYDEQYRHAQADYALSSGRKLFDTKAEELEDLVSIALDEIGERNYKKLESTLKKYNIRMHSGMDDSHYYESHPACTHSSYYFSYFSYQRRMLGQESVSIDASLLINSDDLTQYGDIRQNEIKKIIQDAITENHNAQNTKRLELAKQYAKYYPLLGADADELKLFLDSEQNTYCHTDFEPEATYCKENLSRGYKIFKFISVYDRNLDVKFFGDENCTYELIDLDNGKWYVKKTNNTTGKVETTPEFTDRTKYETFGRIHQTDVVYPSYPQFSFAAGKNQGVRINQTILVKDVVSTLDDTRYTGAEREQIKQQLSDAVRNTEIQDSLYNIVRTQTDSIIAHEFGKTR